MYSIGKVFGAQCVGDSGVERGCRLVPVLPPLVERVTQHAEGAHDLGQSARTGGRVAISAGATQIAAKVDVNPLILTVGSGYRF